MNEEIKNQMLLNSDSYEFFLKQTRKTEKSFFKKAGLCGKEMERVIDEVEQVGFIPNTPQYNLSISRRINLNIFSEALEEGKRYLTISKKFISELDMMKKLSRNILDKDIKFEDEEDRGMFLERYQESVDAAIRMQRMVDKLINDELKMLTSIKFTTSNEEGYENES